MSRHISYLNGYQKPKKEILILSNGCVNLQLQLLYGQMGEISSGVEDEELIEHTRDVLLPFIKEVQIAEEIERRVSPGFGTPEQLIEKISSTVEAATAGLTQRQV